VKDIIKLDWIRPHADKVQQLQDGSELALRLSALRPGLRILFLRSFPGRSLPEELSPEGTVDFLAKPFSPDALLARVGALLHRRGPGQA
jgi:DNA-binding response OmpR family regulator